MVKKKKKNLMNQLVGADEGESASLYPYSFVVLPQLVSLDFEVKDGPVMGRNLGSFGGRTSHCVYRVEASEEEGLESDGCLLFPKRGWVMSRRKRRW